VTLNGEVARLGASADPESDRVALDGRPLRAEHAEYWMLHKPRGVLTTTHDPRRRRTVLDLLPARAARLFPVGRLDLDTEGLVLLTNDGELAHALLHPSHESPREYRLLVEGRVSPETLARLATGIELEEGRSAPARVARPRYDAKTGCTRFELTVVEGRKRQIRRMLAHVGHPVRRLLRVRLGPLRLGRLPEGAARPLTAAEREALLRHARRLRSAQPQRRPPRA
jgi:23S rRNA pseudouridine2605 synthase